MRCERRVGDVHSITCSHYGSVEETQRKTKLAETPTQADESQQPQPAPCAAWIPGLGPAAYRSPGFLRSAGAGQAPFSRPRPSSRAPAPSRPLRPAPRLPRPPGRRRRSRPRGAGGGRWPARLVADNAAAMSASQARAAAAAAGPRAREGDLGCGLPPVPRKRAGGQRGSSSGRDGGSGASLSSP